MGQTGSGSESSLTKFSALRSWIGFRKTTRVRSSGQAAHARPANAAAAPAAVIDKSKDVGPISPMPDIAIGLEPRKGWRANREITSSIAAVIKITYSGSSGRSKKQRGGSGKKTVE